MQRWILPALALLCLTSSAAAVTTTSTFEDVGVAANSYKDDASPSDRFVSGGSGFLNLIDPDFFIPAGWYISSKTDTTTGDYTNIYSAITGGGAGGSATYAVGSPFDSAAFSTDPAHPADTFVDLASGMNPVSIQVTNTTYAYHSMKSGDSFVGDPFGKGDFLLLDIRGYTGLDGTGLLVGEVDFYLGKDGNIVNTWQNVDLTSLAGAKSLRFGLQGSRSDASNGLYTPAYFAADNLVLASVPEPSSLALAALAGAGALAFASRRRSRSGAAARIA